MDTARIKSFAANMDVRADVAAHTGGRSDARIEVAKVAALTAVDTLLTRSGGDAETHLSPHAPPQSAVVVDLVTPLLAANAAKLLARAAATPTDYSHLDPHKTEPERLRAETAAQSAAEIIEEALKPPPALEAHRSLPAPAPTSPDVRPDLHPHGIATAAHAAHDLAAPAHAQRSPVDHARDTERLAALGVEPDRPTGIAPARLGRLLLAAAIAGALIVLLL